MWVFQQLIWYAFQHCGGIFKKKSINMKPTKNSHFQDFGFLPMILGLFLIKLWSNKTRWGKFTPHPSGTRSSLARRSLVLCGSRCESNVRNIREKMTLMPTKVSCLKRSRVLSEEFDVEPSTWFWKFLLSVRSYLSSEWLMDVRIGSILTFE